MSESRQLSAILFADIVGFSGLMQSDEKRALELRQKLKDELEVVVEKYDGQIVKWMVYEAGHLVPRLELIKESLAWYDNYLGEVKQ